MFFLQHVCCVCGETKVNLKSTNETDQSGTRYGDKLKECIPKIDFSDYCLSFICERCVVDLDVTYSFVNRCQKTNALFKFYKSKLDDQESDYGELLVEVLDSHRKQLINNNITSFQDEISFFTSFGGKSDFEQDPFVDDGSQDSVLSDSFIVPCTRRKKLEDLIGKKRKLRSYMKYDKEIKNLPAGKEHAKKLKSRFTKLKKKVLEFPGPDKIKFKCKPRTNAATKRIHCGICKKRVAGLVLFKKHLDVHIDDSHSCVYCQKRYRHRYDIRAHLLRHMNIRPFQCKLCKYRSEHRYKLRQHAATHAATHAVTHATTHAVTHAAPTARKKPEPATEPKKSEMAAAEPYAPITLNSTAACARDALQLGYDESKLIFLQFFGLQSVKEYEVNGRMYCLRSKTNSCASVDYFVMTDSHMQRRPPAHQGKENLPVQVNGRTKVKRVRRAKS